MNSQKSFKIKLSLIVAFALSFLIALGAFLGITLANAERKVTVSGSNNVFRTNENADIWAHREVETVSGDGEDTTVNHDYTMFVFTDDADSVNFRKDLAFKWIENKEKNEVTEEEGEDGEKTETPEIKFDKQEGWFNMEIGFADTNNSGENGNENSLQFKQFVISFESQQYSQTKDGKSTNYLVFEPADNAGEVKVYITHKETEDKDLDAVLARLPESLGTVKNDHIKIDFTNYKSGNYTVAVSDGTTSLTGTFENVGKTYAKSSTSTTTPVTPLSFKALFEEPKDGEENEAHGNAFMTMYCLNNQSFELTGTTTTDNHLDGGQVNDETPPVLCLDKAVPFIRYNGEISFDYTVIDVLTSYPDVPVTAYYMLTAADADAGTTPAYKEDGGEYRKVTDSDNQYIFPHSKHYVPDADDYTGVYGKNIEVKAAVKVVLKLTDTTSTGGQSTYVLLEWFVDDEYLIKVNGDATQTYIAVATDKQGATFAYTDTTAKTSNPDLTGGTVNSEWKAIVDAYQEKVTEAAKDLKAGSKNYFYLPSAESLLGDTVTPYSDLSFSIYYNNGSQQQSTGKNANALSINLTKAGKYLFTVYARDAADNGMYYFDEDGEAIDLEASDIWNMYKQEKDSDFDDMRKYLPWFEFTVEESEISIEDPDEQSTAYVDSSFTPDSFDINGVSYKTVYALYEFQNDLYAKEHNGTALTYEEFAEQKDTLLADYRQYFIRIRPTSELKEGTSDYDKFNDYGWNGSSLTFTPQVANAFYLIKCDASSSETAEPVTKYMTIAAAPKVAPLKGEDTWVQDNVVSIILLCIAGASLVGIILLLVIKPKNKGDIDEVVETPKRSRKK